MMKPYGFFHFAEYEQLNAAWVSGCPVRVTITWSEWDNGSTIDWNCRQARLINELLGEGFHVCPVLRVSPAPSGPPNNKLRYAEFIRALAGRYRGQFPVVSVDREMNDQEDQFKGTVEQYIDTLRLVRDHWKSVDSVARISDGGCQGFALHWVYIMYLVNRGRLTEASKYHWKAFKGAQPSEKEIKNRAVNHATKPNVANAAQLLAAIPGYVDVVNFHHYQHGDSIVELSNFLKLFTNRPLLCNAVGIPNQYVSAREPAALHLTNKLTALKSAGVSPAIWFTSENVADNAGEFAQNGVLTPCARAFEKLLKPNTSWWSRFLSLFSQGLLE